MQLTAVFVVFTFSYVGKAQTLSIESHDEMADYTIAASALSACISAAEYAVFEPPMC